MKNCTECGAAYDGAAFSCPGCGKAPPSPGSPDNYYDDVLPDDYAERNSRKAGNGAGIKIGLTVFGVILAVAACAAILTLL
jgi:hypothetical protein